MTGATRVLSLLPLLGHPRDSKRIDMLKSEGFDVEVAAFERRYHQGRMPECSVTLLGRLEHGKYLRRLYRMLMSCLTLRRLIRNVDLVYASGSDLGLLAHIAGLGLGKPVVIEVGDIRELLTGNTIISSVARYVDRFVSQRAALLVVTAYGFVEEYYRKWLKVTTSALVIENKLEPGLSRGRFDASFQPGQRRIGYFGMLRCKRSWQTLELLARRSPRIELVVGGIAFEPTDLERRIGLLPNAKWLAEYKSPQDLPELYSQVDLIWASPYPGPDEHNWRWARSNRFYEACHFGKPIIAFVGSGDGKEVRKFDIGLEVGSGGIDDDVSLVSSITDLDMDRWHSNLTSLDPGIYTYTNDSARLGNAIDSIVEQKTSRHIASV